ncbi:alpha/beta hydrolase [Sphingomonas sp. RIT328]|uniref:alpha/beta hydrolase n=1 Tax=Sphingomonas sp. RIT328 TaxID=1470591 RepID=UPI000447824D|nr:alpha/beta hydrolase [Sphingomonas sp. RIT328]EZP48996.1 Dienelactone hydrolase [Sphingomonas sp. RIT328]
MTPFRLALLTALTIGAASGACGRAGKPDAPPAPARTSAPSTWQPRAGLRQMRIWPGAAPDGTFRPQPPESVQSYPDPGATGGISAAVLNVSVPTMTIMPARGHANGAAVIVFPGGGFQKVFVDLEGVEICDWLTGRGITCIVSKYRAPGGNDFWDDKTQRRIIPAIPRALQDAQRTIRLVRSMAGRLGIDPHRIGVLGMSAGGYLVAQTSNIVEPTYRPVDAVDAVSSRPDFAVALYPGHICRQHGTFDPKLPVSRAAPPTFIAQAWNDPVDPICNSLMYASALDKAGVSTEVHLFAKGGHAFALRHGSEPVGQWPRLVELWLRAIGMVSA